MASNISGKIRSTDGIGYIVLGGKDSVMSNKSYWDIYSLETDHALKTGQLTPESLSVGIKMAAGKAGITLPRKTDFIR